MPPTPEDYERELSQLREEIQRLRTQGIDKPVSFVSLGPSSDHGGQLSIAGLEEMFMVLDRQMVVKVVNNLMAEWLGLPKSNSARGRSLAQIDDSPLGSGVLYSLVESTWNIGEPALVERTVEEGDEVATYRIAVQPKPSGVQLVIQNVTRLRKLESTLIKYVSENVFQEMISRPEEDFLAVRKLDVTVLFADLRGFTGLTESLPPEQVRQQINEYLACMVECVHRFDGTVISFAGDEVFAVWGAPVPVENHLVLALRCALEMQSAYSKVMKKWTTEGKPAPGLGIGFNSGEAVCGNIGPPERLGYTTLGHTTNIAARLCSAAQKNEILITRDTYQLIASKGAEIAKIKIQIYFTEKEPMAFKNVSKKIQVMGVERAESASNIISQIAERG